MRAKQFGRVFFSFVAIQLVGTSFPPKSSHAATNPGASSIQGLTFSVADRFSHQGNEPGNLEGAEIGTHLHSSNALPLSPLNVARGVAEVGGFFGDEEVRGLSEFDLSGHAPAESMSLEFDVADVSELTGLLVPGGLFGQESYTGMINVLAYDGDHVEDVDDYQKEPLGMIGTIAARPLSVGDTLSFDITQLLNSQMQQGSKSLGIRLQIEPRNLSAGAASFDNFRLVMVPEPGTFLLLVLGTLALLQMTASGLNLGISRGALAPGSLKRNRTLTRSG